MNVTALRGDALRDEIDALAQLRMTVFRDWPYLYDGDMAYERAYLQHYQTTPEAVVVAAHVGDWLVGAATATPLREHAGEFGAAVANSGLDIDATFYCGESLLLPSYRGRGIGHTFFEMREAHARELGYTHMCFCAVLRPQDHPMRPATYRPLDSFWEGRGYKRLPGSIAHFKWKDIDTGTESAKALQFWMRRLD